MRMSPYFSAVFTKRDIPFALSSKTNKLFEEKKKEKNLCLELVTIKKIGKDVKRHFPESSTSHL